MSLDVTTNFELPLPHPDNNPKLVDVPRLRAALTAIDTLLKELQLEDGSIREAIAALDDAKADKDQVAINITNAVSAAVSALLAEAPEAYDTLKEIADKLDDNDNVVGAILSSIGTLQSGKLDKSAAASEEDVDEGESETTYITPKELRVREEKVVEYVVNRIGDIVTTALSEPDLPGTWLPCDGKKYLASAFPDLAEVCGTKFGKYQLTSQTLPTATMSNCGSANGVSYFYSYVNPSFALYRVTPDGVVTQVATTSISQAPSSPKICNIGETLMMKTAEMNVMRSVDNGLTWSHFSPNISSNPTVHAIAAYKGYFYLKAYDSSGHNSNGIYKSATGAQGSWTKVWPLSPDNTTENLNLVSSQNQHLHTAGERLYLPAGGSRYLYTDDGETWTLETIPSLIAGYSVLTVTHIDGLLYKTFQASDLGSAGIYRTADGLTWELVAPVGFGGLGNMLSAIGNNHTVYGGDASDILVISMSDTNISNSQTVYASAKGTTGKIWSRVYRQTTSDNGPRNICAPAGDLFYFSNGTSMLLATPAEVEGEFRVPGPEFVGQNMFIKAAMS